jgi:Uma2 family endonuclease
VHLDKQAFLAWVQGREERYELVGGHVVMMTGASRNHGRIVSNLVFALRSQLNPQWEIIADFGLDSGPKTLRYPDIVVDRADSDGADYTANAPVLLIEVLSPSSETLDLEDKAAEYLRLSNLAAYIVFAQREPKAWIWLREAGHFEKTPREIADLNKTIRIAALDIDLALTAVYAGIKFG